MGKESSYFTDLDIAVKKLLYGSSVNSKRGSYDMSISNRGHRDTWNGENTPSSSVSRMINAYR